MMTRRDSARCRRPMRELTRGVQGREALKETADVRGGDAGHGAARLVRGRADVRRDDDVREGEEPWIDGGLVLEDVESGAAEVVALQGVAESVLVDDLSPRRIDEERSMFHALPRCGVGGVVRLAGERHMDGDDVTRGQQLVDRLTAPAADD